MSGGLRRLGTAPAQRPGCSYGGDCPDVFEDGEGGDFVMVGERAPRRGLPADAVFTDKSSVVVIPREVLLAAARQMREEGLL